MSILVNRVRAAGAPTIYPYVTGEKIEIYRQSDYGLYTMLCTDSLGAGFTSEDVKIAAAEWRRRYPELPHSSKRWAEAAHREAQRQS